MKHVCLLISFIFSFLMCSFAQNAGQYNVRFSLISIDCQSQSFYVDIEVQASSPSSTFRITDQNYRFSFNRGAIEPIDPPILFPDTNPDDRTFHISEELALSGFVARDGAFSFFEAHTLTGSLDTLVSYNVRLAGGDGYPVYAEEWVKVGRLRVLYGPQAGGPGQTTISPIHIQWHTHDQAWFPNTFVGEMYNGVKMEAAEGSYQDFLLDPGALCGSNLPIELAYFRGEDQGCKVELEWKTDSETDNDYFIIEKSPDGISYRPIATVDGAGTTEVPLIYNLIDEDVGIDNYYKLTQVDFDGTSTTSNSIYVRSSCFDENVATGITDIFPNPLNPGKPLKLTIFTDKDVEDAELLISNALGQVIIQQSVELFSGGNNFEIGGLDDIAIGTYFIYVQGSDWISDPGKFVRIY